MLETTGILAHVVGPSLRAHLGDLLSLIIDALQDAGEGRKRDMAVLTLAQVLLSEPQTPHALKPRELALGRAASATWPSPRSPRCLPGTLDAKLKSLHQDAGVELRAQPARAHARPGGSFAS